MSLVAVKTMRFLLPSENLQILFWIAHMCLLSLNIVPKVSIFDISHGKSAQMVQEIIELEILIRMQVFWGICSIRKGGVHLSKQGNFKD